MFRVATADATIGGRPVSEGDRLALLYPSGNRDEDVFDDPFRFDIRRSPNQQIAFGFGTHFCLGASLARVELRLLIERLVATITDLEVLAPPDIEDNIFVGAVRSLQSSAERRVGKECVSTCRSRRSPYHSKTNKPTKQTQP